MGVWSRIRQKLFGSRFATYKSSTTEAPAKTTAEQRQLPALQVTSPEIVLYSPTLPQQQQDHTEEHAVQAQETHTPVITQVPPFRPMAATPYTLQIVLRNSSSCSNAWAYVTGYALDHDNHLVLLQSNGTSTYFPANPPAIGSHLIVDCGIALGAPGSSRAITIPRIAGGRIWISLDAKLSFLLNPGGDGGRAALVEPSVSNPSDLNYRIRWSFAEFTFNAEQLYANISFVDFLAVPIGLSLTNAAGVVQRVPGLPAGALRAVAAQLVAQMRADGQPGWGHLVVTLNSDGTGGILRVLSPNNGRILFSGDFEGYFEPYVRQVVQHYLPSNGGNTFTVHIFGQALKGHTEQPSAANGNNAIFVGAEAFAAPSTRDILTCDSGPFATVPGRNLRNALIPQLAAAFNRSSWLASRELPSDVQAFYSGWVTNHFARVVHAALAGVGGAGYAFPYDDVTPAGGVDQSGFVSDGAPVELTVEVRDP